jgi:DNA (cytosine-5)-methyltransferase 1
MQQKNIGKASHTSSPATLPAISLFSGAGGLDLGIERAGFGVRLCVEVDEIAKQTLSKNGQERLASPGDVHMLTAAEILEQAGLRRGEIALLAGGPPCQPFSKAGYWASGDSLRLKDPRARTFDAFLDIVDATLPEVFLLENVRGLAYKDKDQGIRLVRSRVDQLNKRRRTSYQVTVLHINAAEHGVPQLRERVFIVGHRHGKSFQQPTPTHGAPDDPRVGAGQLQPYCTAWDSIGDLDIDLWPAELNATGAWAKLLPSIPEGQNYLWHTRRGGGLPIFGWRTRYWSFLLKLAKSEPAWTIQAEPGPATGPFHWRSRKLSIRELCRLQTFPDEYEILGTYREAYRQVGNAVPPALGELLGLEIRRQLLGERVRHELSLTPERQAGCPPPERRRPVPRNYQRLQGKHADHPGVGLGPGAQRRAA